MATCIILTLINGMFEYLFQPELEPVEPMETSPENGTFKSVSGSQGLCSALNVILLVISVV